MTGHEDLSRTEGLKSASDRVFGFVAAGFAMIMALSPSLRGQTPRWWAAVISLLFLAVALVRPSLLKPLNRLWTAFAGFMNRIVTAATTAVLFFLVFTPSGFLFRLFNRHAMGRRYEPALTTYWLTRQPPGPPPASMVNRF